jgi:hypothetical protein
MVQPRDQMSADVVASSFEMISGATANRSLASTHVRVRVRACVRACEQL